MNLKYVYMKHWEGLLAQLKYFIKRKPE